MTYNWYPSFAPPTLSKFGGQKWPRATNLTLLRRRGRAWRIYYTLDGSDPRLTGGGVSPSALIYHVGTPVTLTQSTLFHTRA